MRPLEGITVLDCTHYAAGPFASLQLADAGARVIKVERPGTGEHYRTSAPALAGDPAERVGAYFLRFNRNKESIELDIHSPDGHALFLDLCAEADVLIVSWKQATLARLGIDYAALAERCPRLVYLSISGFGHSDVLPSPFDDRPAFASIAEALSGFMLQVGDTDCRPHRSGTSLADLACGLYGALGVSMALHQRERTGRGQHVDVSLYDTMLAFNERAIFMTALTGEEPARGSEGNFCPYDSYRAADGWVVICVMTQAHWRALTGLLAIPEWADDKRFADGRRRATHRAEIDPVLQEWLDRRSAEVAGAELRAVGIPATEIRSAAGALDCPQAAAREMFVRISDPLHGDHLAVGRPVKLGDDLRPPMQPPPRLGASTTAVLSDLLGLGSDEVDRLRETGAIG